MATIVCRSDDTKTADTVRLTVDLTTREAQRVQPVPETGRLQRLQGPLRVLERGRAVPDDRRRGEDPRSAGQGRVRAALG